MRNIRVVTLFAAASLAACSNSHIPSPADLPIVYKIDVQQGNVVTQEMLAQLQPGMDKAKVKYIMGTPLVVDVFHQSRWDYLFTMQKRGGEREQRRVSLYFTDDKLDHIEGDVTPAAGEIAVSDPRRDTTVEVPGQEAKTLVGRIKQTFSDEEEAAAKAEEGRSDASQQGTAVNSEGGKASQVTGAVPQEDTGAKAGEARRDDGATATEDAAGAGDEGKAETGTEKKKTAAVVIPDDAPKPPQKGFFRRMLEKMGVGDNEEGEYESADPKYRDPSNPENAP